MGNVNFKALNIPDVESLEGSSRGDFFNRSADIANRLVINLPQYAEHLSRYGLDRQTAANQAIFDHEFGLANRENGEFDSLLRLGHLKQEYWRSITSRFLMKGVNLGFSPTEAIVLEEGLKIASVMDHVYFAWRGSLVDSELGRKLKQMGPEAGAEWFTQKEVVNPYSVVEGEGEELIQIPYVNAFAEEYRKISLILDQLVERLRVLKGSDEAEAYANYFRLYQEASMESDLGKLEERWRDVDVAWMDIRGSLQPVHAMESYAEPARLRVDPEFRLVLTDESAHSLNNTANLTQQALIRDYREDFSSVFSSLIKSLPAMENSMVRAITTVVMSGTNIDFRPAGQNVPNRADVRASKGVKIFLDKKSMTIRFEQMKRYVAAVFGEDFANRDFTDPDFLISGGIGIAGHEVSHNAFITPDTDKRVGRTLLSLLEETKADLGGILFLPKRAERGELDKDILKRKVVLRLGEGLRFLKFQGEAPLEPYYNIAVVDFNLLIDSGVVRKINQVWKIDLSDDVVQRYYKEVSNTFYRFAQAYDTYDKEAVQKLLIDYRRETSEILELVKRVKSID